MYCRFCGSKLDEDAIFCPRCGGKIKSKREKGKNRIIPFLLLSVMLICFSMYGIHQHHNTEKYIVNTKYKKVAESFKERFKMLDTATDVKYVVTEIDDTSYVKAIGKWDKETHTFAGFQEKGKWQSTAMQNGDIFDNQMNEDLVYMVEEKMQAKANKIVIYNKEFQNLDVLELNEK